MKYTIQQFCCCESEFKSNFRLSLSQPNKWYIQNGVYKRINKFIYIFFFGRNFTIKHFLYSVYYVADLLHVYDDRILLAVCQNITAEFSGNFI